MAGLHSQIVNRFRFGHVFMAETGTSVGEISGQSKAINSVDFRPTRPFRIVTASEDNTLAVFEGPPFKFKCTKQVGSALKIIYVLTSTFRAFDFSANWIVL